MERLAAILIAILSVCLIGCKGTSDPAGSEPNSESVPQSASANPEAERAGVEAAEAWLRMIDERDYSQSWDEAAVLFRNAVNKETWLQQVEAFRRPLGKCTNRKLKGTTYSTTMPGAPDGEYVVIQFDSSFENKMAAIETVTPMKEEDGTWKVSGYFIK